MPYPESARHDACATMASVGDCCIDDYGDGRYIGGNAANVAVGWALAGERSAYFGAAGDDAAGEAIRTGLAAAGVRTERMVRGTEPTDRTWLRLMGDGDRVIEAEELRSLRGYRPSAADVELLAGMRWVHGAALADPEVLARAMAAHGVPMSYDFATDVEAELPAPLAVAFYSFAEAPGPPVTRRLAAAIERGTSVAVGLCGAAGSVAVAGDGVVELAAAADVAVVDTCGAGDSYIAAFTAARLAGAPLERCMRSATAAAARTCAHRGAWRQAPLPLEPIEIPS
ncbi:PfkB family carbohydrate kinase [Conexibacter sp. CPCC 206217]|uniref:PfkB family carbohydrate kinase n=1 Tax=Conexibacter sp. CPCC 206217 TaxID=3064574 RepID=UPI00271D2472|nr:PfkB family carbohydrate kinase [Conexibacter sp. CPCC 206217]MDO8209636.1 PfkB family carbohydrate kinase [Conexibacter sp. CPCC 206217]